MVCCEGKGISDVVAKKGNDQRVWGLRGDGKA